MKIGIVGLPLSGHLNPMTALARKLKARGHEAILFGVPDAEPAARAANLGFVSYGEREFPCGAIEQKWSQVARLQGDEVLRYTLTHIQPELVRVGLQYLPQKFLQTGIEALVIDSVYFFISLIPMRMKMPFAHAHYVLNLDFSGSTPLCFRTWPYETAPEALALNQETLKMLGELLAPVAEAAMPYAQKAGMHINWSDPYATMSKLLIVSQTPKAFDFPIDTWPAQFRYAGPFCDGDGREPIAFPWEKLNGKPLIYASLGTLVNGLENIYSAILNATSGLPDVQLVLSLGRNVDVNNLGPVPSNVIAVQKAPQMELLKRASLCITHAGLNTALESLANGVPMVAIPIGYDQPGVAARIKHHRVGEFVEPSHLTADRLKDSIQLVLSNPGYRDKARYFQKAIAQARGLDTAADAIEHAFGQHRGAVSAPRPPVSSTQDFIEWPAFL